MLVTVKHTVAACDFAILTPYQLLVTLEQRLRLAFEYTPAKTLS
jgi:hypothetical protein